MAVQSNTSIKNEIVSSQEEGTLSMPVSGTDQVQDNKKNKFPGFNLYIKNLDDSFTDVTLREVFDSFGTITSAKVMCDSSGKSKGFGFVCFTTLEEANAAVAKMNGRIVGTKPLYVAMAQKKEERKQYLNTKYTNLSTNGNAYRPPVVLRPAVHEPVMSPSYLPGSNAVNAPMQLRSVSNNEMVNPNSAGVTYVMPTNPPVTYMPMYYQPLYLFPNLNVVPPAPAQVPVIHQPIYLHSSKTNTLIYSTGVQTNPPQMPVPGVQVYTSSHNNLDRAGVAVHTISTRGVPPKDKEPYDEQDDHIETLAHEIQNKAIVSSDVPDTKYNYHINPAAQDVSPA